MKKELIVVAGLFCAAQLFAQSVNTTYYAPNGESVHATFDAEHKND